MRVVRICSLAAGLFLALGLSMSRAADLSVRTPDLADGKAMAEKWCSHCHMISPGDKRAGDAAPSFTAIARMPSTTEMSLRAFLQTPHVRMPDYHLSRDESADLVAYILSLRDK
jgi:mono/diheme cytochrome c family protein